MPDPTPLDRAFTGLLALGILLWLLTAGLAALGAWGLLHGDTFDGALQLLLAALLPAGGWEFTGCGVGEQHWFGLLAAPGAVNHFEVP